MLRPVATALAENLTTVRERTLALVAHLDAADHAFAYLEDVRARTLDALDGRGPDPVLHEMVLRHELQHTETMRQAMGLGGLLPPGEPALRPVPSPEDW